MNDNRYLLKIMTYNIYGGKRVLTSKLSKYTFVRKIFNLLPITFLNNFKSIIKLLHNESAHIIGLQEINENDKYGYQVNSIKDNLQMNGVFASNVKIRNGYYGVGLLLLLHIVVEIGDLEINDFKYTLRIK